MSKSILSAIIILLLLTISLSGCTTPTVGQQFRDIMAQINADCRRDKLGPYLDKNDPDYMQKRARTDCDILEIKPADPLATEEGRFAYSIQLPGPHGKVQTQYQPGMSAESYFKELCEKDAGEWIFRTVEGVDGLFQGRRMQPYPGAYSDLVFVSREFSEMRSLEPELRLAQPTSGRYNFFEIPTADDKKQTGSFTRFYRGELNTSKYGGNFQTYRKNGQIARVPYILQEVRTNTLNSHYSYTWRQVSTSDMLENGITGGESIIYDRSTGEILAYRRFFIRMWPRPDSRYTRMIHGEQCRPSFSGELSDFIEKVLIPVNPAE